MIVCFEGKIYSSDADGKEGCNLFKEYFEFDDYCIDAVLDVYLQQWCDFMYPELARETASWWEIDVVNGDDLFG